MRKSYESFQQLIIKKLSEMEKLVIFIIDAPCAGKVPCVIAWVPLLKERLNRNDIAVR